MSPITIVSDPPNCGITYNCHSDYSRGVIYDHNVFIVQATEFTANIMLKKFYEIGHRSPEPFFPSIDKCQNSCSTKIQFFKTISSQQCFQTFSKIMTTVDIRKHVDKILR